MDTVSSRAQVSLTDEASWRRNLAVCVFGAFTSVLGMTILLPFLPLYVAQLGVRGHAAVVSWSAVAFGVTFLVAGVAAPLWGSLGDRFGRKLILVRASLGMAVCMGLIGTAQTIWELVALRALAGLLGGYASGATILVATQTPKAQSGWALGTLSSGIMAGALLGPLVGGMLPPLIGIRWTFFLAGAVIFVAFVATALLIHEAPRSSRPRRVKNRAWALVEDRRTVLAMLLTSLLLTMADFSIEPIITLYVAQLGVPAGRVTMIAGFAMSAAALGNLLSAARIGRIGDRVGHTRVVALGLVAGAVLLVPQAMVATGWQLIALRFFMGIALAGLQPALTSLIRHAVPNEIAGGILAWGISAQYLGQVTGPLLGGAIGAWCGMRPVFLVTALLMLAGAGLVVASSRARRR